MLTLKENDFFTRVGPGAPAGEFLRRYWLPVAVTQELTPKCPTKFVRVLGEGLVLFLDRSDRVGLLADHCSHRSASLLYGRVEERGIACAYHGWLYNTEGRILETPPERNEAIMKTVRQKAYPVRRFAGLYWAYLGPEPAPEIPRYDVLVRKDGTRKLQVYDRVDCNWFQAVENSADPDHTQILHQEFGDGADGRKPAGTTRGFVDDVDFYEIYETPYGIMKKRHFKNGLLDSHPLFFPTFLRTSNNMQFRIPSDDTSFFEFRIAFTPTDDGSDAGKEEPVVEYMKPHKAPLDALHPFTRFTMNSVYAQDMMAWETQGRIADRAIEHLAYSDRGVLLFRQMVKQNIERVLAGQDPIGVVRERDHEMIDTGLAGSPWSPYLNPRGRETSMGVSKDPEVLYRIGVSDE
jgi:5,5'-dehydrodivanillate O-demethylase